jgi:hypothetical protein
VTQVVERLPSKDETLISNPSAAKKKKKEKARDHQFKFHHHWDKRT